MAHQLESWNFLQEAEDLKNNHYKKIAEFLMFSLRSLEKYLWYLKQGLIIATSVKKF